MSNIFYILFEFCDFTSPYEDCLADYEDEEGNFIKLQIHSVWKWVKIMSKIIKWIMLVLSQHNPLIILFIKILHPKFIENNFRHHIHDELHLSFITE